MSETPTTPPTTTEAPVAETRPTPAPAKPIHGAHFGIGRRKAAVARVRIKPGSGQFTVNKKRSLDEYFGRDQDRNHSLSPLRLTGLTQKYDIFVNVHGGGSHGQAGAIRLGIARAIIKAEPQHYQALKAGGYLTRDAREVERKKPGQAGARRSFQYSKR